MAVYAINMEGDGMSRKDYQLVVAALGAAYRAARGDREQMVVCLTAGELSLAFSKDNPRFDSARFESAFFDAAGIVM